MNNSKKKANKDRSHVYVIGEKGNKFFPARDKIYKIGILAEQEGGNNVFHGRTRALNQGNPSALEVLYSVYCGTYSQARKIEKEIHIL